MKTDRGAKERGNRNRTRIPTHFDTKCRTLAKAIAKTGTRLRIALSAEAAAEPFLIHARYEIRSRMHVYGETETEATVTRGLQAADSTCQEFLNEAADIGRRLSTPDIPLPVLWDEPTLVIAGIAPGTIARWRKRRLERTSPGGRIA